jgi:hypothetical protein
MVFFDHAIQPTLYRRGRLPSVRIALSMYICVEIDLILESVMFLFCFFNPTEASEVILL